MPGRERRLPARQCAVLPGVLRLFELQRLTFAGMVNRVQRISRHVTIGRVTCLPQVPANRVHTIRG